MADFDAAAVKRRLRERLNALVNREEALSRHLRGQDGRLEADFGDIANFTGNDEVLEGLEDAALAELRHIRAALERVEAGTYGTCISCGQDIAPRRLEALPHAAKCVSCAA